jgi:hypothetical protein
MWHSISILVGSSGSLLLQDAVAINDHGQIACTAWDSVSKKSHVVQLTPVPEPFTVALLGIGAVALLGYAGRRRKTNNASALNR